MADLNFQQFSTVQSDQQLQPNTLASAATLVPTGFLTYVTGTTVISTITPPVSGLVMIALVFTATTPVAMTTTGNIANAVEPTANVPCLLIYDNRARKWTGFAGNVT